VSLYWPLIGLSPYDAYNVCRENAADLIVLGLHETGITTCAANQVAATIPNLDDGNQYMKHCNYSLSRPDHW
jgi:hypothetical protein